MVIGETGKKMAAFIPAYLKLLPTGDLSGTRAVLSFVAEKRFKNTYLNLMDQYYSCYHAFDYPPLDRPISRAEYQRALKFAAICGLQRLDQRQRWRGG